MASATCSGVPTRHDVLPSAPVARAIGIHRRSSWMSRSSAKPISRLPALSTGPAAFSCRLQPFFPVIAGEDAVRLVPGVALARRDDRADRDVEPDRAAERGGLGAERRHALARRGERLGVDRVDVAVPRAHVERAGRGAAEEQRGMRLLQRAHVGGGAFHAVELAGEIRTARRLDQASFISSRYSAARR